MTSRELAELAQGNNAFALALYAKLKEQEGNLFFSPFSISTALAMTFAGAAGKTAEEMAEVLHFTLDQDSLHAAFKALMDSLARSQGYTLSIANALWLNQGYKLLKTFLKLIDKNYGKELYQVNFADPEPARQRINKWVKDKTKGKITDLIPEGVLTPLTRLVLTNAIYFKGDWDTQFDERQTHDQPFTLLDGSEIQAPLMHQKETFRYTETDHFQVLEMPYVKERLSMVFFLPKERGGLPRVEKHLTTEYVANILEYLGRQKVIVFLPRYKMTVTFKLNEVLKAMGMEEAFSEENADFTNMTHEEPGLYISAVLHKAYVDVNEEGSEAAAATAVVMMTRSMARPRPTPVFRADHPFVFMIRDRETGSILFMGRVMNPKIS
ncbi:MAG: serpin family protein [Promethearchaeota archaeon]